MRCRERQGRHRSRGQAGEPCSAPMSCSPQAAAFTLPCKDLARESIQQKDKEYPLEGDAPVTCLPTSHLAVGETEAQRGEGIARACTRPAGCVRAAQASASGLCDLGQVRSLAREDTGAGPGQEARRTLPSGSQVKPPNPWRGTGGEGRGRCPRKLPTHCRGLTPSPKAQGRAAELKPRQAGDSLPQRGARGLGVAQ